MRRGASKPTEGANERLTPTMNSLIQPRSSGRLSVEEFLAFIAVRPSEERWELIDGVAYMMTPPTLKHQVVAKNLAFELNLHFRDRSLAFSALQEIGLIVPEVERFRPEADVAVLDDVMDLETSYADRFYLVAEVRSDSNTDHEIELKRVRYLQHPVNLHCLVISQTEVKVEVWSRRNDWQRTELTRLDQAIEMPEWNLSIPLTALYRGTALARG